MVVGHRACVVYSFITPFLFSVCSFVLPTRAVCSLMRKGRKDLRRRDKTGSDMPAFRQQVKEVSQ